jgi:asparagine synthase (glutamine-hydrolysing)
MCGICGVTWTNPDKAIDRTILDQMTDILQHRGPDDRGTYYDYDTGIGLGQRRLSILDLSPNGRQPMGNEDGSIQVVLNGEIYNYQILRNELIQLGHQFKSNTDTEILVHLYEEEKEKMLERLNGMFAFAIWDTRERRLFFARDRIGKKPLFYRYESGRFLFASELKSIVTIKDVPRKVNNNSLSDYFLYGYIPHPNTIYDGISKLSPAHFGVWQNDQLFIKRYWEPNFNEEVNRLSQEEWSNELRYLLTDAVRIRLRSDVPIGAFLSGGIDSSIITGLMQQESSQQIRTFSIGFDQQEFDETPFARQIAEQHGTCHQEFFVQPSIQDLLPKLVWHYDEPFADSSAIPTWYLCEMTRKEVTVALSGDGGDELFAGYDRYRAARMGMITRRLPLFFRRFMAGTIHGVIPDSLKKGSTLRRIKRYLETLDKEPLEQYSLWLTAFNSKQRTNLFTDSFYESIKMHNPLEFMKQALLNCAERDTVSQFSLIDFQTYIPGDIMTKVDIASMAHSLECRSPLLDYRIVELASKIPVHLKMNARRGKIIFRKTFQNILPYNINNRPKKGFSVPIADWFRNTLKDTIRDVLLDSRCIQRGYFKRTSIERMLEEHLSAKVDHAHRIWQILILELWMRQWIDSL